MLENDRIEPPNRGKDARLNNLARASAADNKLKETMDTTNKNDVAADVGGLTRQGLKADPDGAPYVGPRIDGDYYLVSDVQRLLATKAQAAGTSAPLTEQQVADMLAASDIVTEFGHRTLINGEPMHARLGFLTQFANHVLAATPAPQVSAAEQPDWDSLIYPPKALLKREDWNPLTRKPKASAEQPSTAGSAKGGNTCDTPRFKEITGRIYGAAEKGMRDVFDIEVGELCNYLAHVARQPAAATAEPYALYDRIVRLSERFKQHPQLKAVIGREALILRCVDAVSEPAATALPVARQPQAAPVERVAADEPCAESDGCPTERAVLQRFWRANQRAATQAAPTLGSTAQADESKLTIRDGIWWPEGYCRDPNGEIIAPKGKHVDFKFGRDIGYAEGLVAHRDSVAAIERRARAPQAERAAVPEGWKDAIFSAMDKAFDITHSKGKSHDGALVIDDTQVGVEFAIKQFEIMLAAAPVAQEVEPGSARADITVDEVLERLSKNSYAQYLIKLEEGQIDALLSASICTEGSQQTAPEESSAVATVRVKDGHPISHTWWSAGCDKLPDGYYELFAAAQAAPRSTEAGAQAAPAFFGVDLGEDGIALVRDAALEEAAKLCNDADKSTHPADLADAIRALRTTSTEGKEQP